MAVPSSGVYRLGPGISRDHILEEDAPLIAPGALSSVYECVSSLAPPIAAITRLPTVCEC